MYYEQFQSAPPDGRIQTTIAINSNSHPRLTDHRLMAIVSDPNTVEPGSARAPSVGTVRYIAPVVTGEQPFSGVKDDAVVEGVRPSRPPDPNEWVSNDVWNIASSCCSSSWDGRPDIYFATNALNNTACAVEARRKKLCAPNGQGKRTSRSGSGASYRYQS